MYKKRKNETLFVILFVVLLFAPLIYWDYCRLFGFPQPLIKLDEVLSREYASIYSSILIAIYILLAFIFWAIHKKRKISLFFVVLIYGFMFLTLIIGVISSLKNVLN